MAAKKTTMQPAAIASGFRERGGQGRRRADEEQRHDVEEVPVADDLRPAEAHVVRGRLDREEDDRREEEGRERTLPVAPRAVERGEHPPAAEHQRYEAGSDRDRVDVACSRRPCVERQERPLLERHRVRAEEASHGVRDRSRERDDRSDRIERGEHRVAHDRRARAGGGPPPPRPVTGRELAAHLVAEDGEREHEREHGELRTGEEGEAERGDREEVVADARGHDRELQSEERPEEGGVRGRLGHDEPGEDHPQRAHGQGCRSQCPWAGQDLSPEQVGRDDGARHHDRVQDVRRPEGRRRRQRAVERRDEQRVELVRDRDRRPVDGGERRAGLTDGGGELRVLELVGHDRPVANPARVPERSTTLAQAQTSPTPIVAASDGFARTRSAIPVFSCRPVPAADEAIASS